MANTTTSINSDRLDVRFNIVLHLILIFCGACMLCAAVLAAFAPIPYAENPLLVRIGMGYCGIPASLALIGINLRKVLFRRSAVRIDEDGITDHTSAFSSGFTSWDDLREVYLLRLKNDDFLCAEPLDYDAWFAKLTKQQQRLASANRDLGFAPIRIQFRKVSDHVSSKDGVSFCKRIKPKKVGAVRKPRY